MKLFVTGTDTDVGKTVFCAALSGALKAAYWKPIQAGTLESSDSDTICKLSGNAPAMVLAEGYRLNTACSPHRAAELDSIVIEPDKLQLPDVDPLVIEGAGGLLVPVTPKVLLIDLVVRWQLPVVLVARTKLGTINHSLLSIEALRSRNIPLLGIAFVGEANADSEQVICRLGRTKRLGRLPIIDPLDQSTLSEAFAVNFRVDDFR
ncbi:MAG TPA: dethiobiotin synthase [Sphingomicrobium sp.]|nr:dethiobiotin synthase [Sphingomicrobium sp.]